MPISEKEFKNKSEIELDLRGGRMSFWLLGFMTKNKHLAYTTQEIADLVPKNIVVNVKFVKASVYSTLSKFIVKGFVMKKGSYYKRTEVTKAKTKSAKKKKKRK